MVKQEIILMKWEVLLTSLGINLYRTRSLCSSFSLKSIYHRLFLVKPGHNPMRAMAVSLGLELFYLAKLLLLKLRKLKAVKEVVG